MRVAVLISPIFLLCHCAPAPVAAITPAEPITPAAEPAPAIAAPVSPKTPPKPAFATRSEVSGITFEGVTFDSRSHRLIVVDQPDGPGSLIADAATAARADGGLAATNAGFFTPAGEPLGLVVSSGKRAGVWNSQSSLGSGVWHEDPSGTSAITRREALGRQAASSMRELIQAGPMLVENGRPVSGLNATKHSVRTFLLWDGGTRWWLGRASPCSLSGLAAALAHSQPAGWSVRHALNLDGGRSSDLWISGALKGGPLVQRPPWNRPVRNFLVLMPR